MATPANRRKLWIIALGACLLVLFVALAALNAFNTQLPQARHDPADLVFTGLSIVAFLLFVTVLILLVRNVLKLYADQRSRVMGTRLRTRMLWGAVLVSLIPIVFMYVFSYLLMNRAVDRWFSQPVTEMRDDSNRMALELARYTTANARAEADSIASSPARRASPSSQPKPPAHPAPASKQQAHRSIHAPSHGVRRSHRRTLGLASASRSNLSGPAPARDHPAERLRHRLSRGPRHRLLPNAAAGRSHRAGQNLASRSDRRTKTADANPPHRHRSNRCRHPGRRPTQRSPVFSIGTTDYALGATTSSRATPSSSACPCPSAWPLP